MPPQTENVIEQKIDPANTNHPIHQITPASKYLALLLFVILPFLGAYVGYQVALERVVEAPVATIEARPQATQLESTDAPSAAITNISESDSDTESVDTASVPRQLNSTSSSRYLVEEYECVTALNNYPHLCFRLIERSSNKIVVENINDRAKELGVLLGTSSRAELQAVHYMTENGLRFYFMVGVPDSDACCALAVFDANTLAITAADNLYTSVGMSTFSLTNRYIASVAEDKKTINVADLEVGKVIKSATLTTGHLIHSYCGFSGGEALITYQATSSSFLYGIYKDGPHSKTTDDSYCYNDKIGEGVITVR